MRSTRKMMWLGLVVVLAMVLSACGGPAATPAATEAAPAAATTEAAPAAATTEAATEAAPAEATTEAATEATEAAAPAEATTAAAVDVTVPEGTQIALVTKYPGNPFFVKMEEGATKEAEAKGVKLMVASGTYDGDNETQVTAIENMINAGVKGLLITANQSTGIVPTIKKARDAGILVIALDTPLDPADAADATFATNNVTAGELIGKYAKAALGDKPAKIALLDGTAGTTVSDMRRDGFLQGFGIKADDPSIVCQADTNGMSDRSQPAMENCLTKEPDINVVYTVNEPAAFGANTALKAAGKDKDVIVVSVDGGCSGVQGVVDGQIAATSQQYPLKMATLGVDALVQYIADGTKPPASVDTGVTLIAGKAVEGVDSQDTTYGLDNCWGTR